MGCLLACHLLPGNYRPACLPTCSALPRPAPAAQVQELAEHICGLLDKGLKRLTRMSKRGIDIAERVRIPHFDLQFPCTEHARGGLMSWLHVCAAIAGSQCSPCHWRVCSTHCLPPDLTLPGLACTALPAARPA